MDMLILNKVRLVFPAPSVMQYFVYLPVTCAQLSEIAREMAHSLVPSIITSGETAFRSVPQHEKHVQRNQLIDNSFCWHLTLPLIFVVNVD